MNSPNQQFLLDMIDQMQRDQPIGKIVSRNVDQIIKKHPIPPEKKQKKKKDRSKPKKTEKKQ